MGFYLVRYVMYVFPRGSSKEDLCWENEHQSELKIIMDIVKNLQFCPV